MLAVVDGLSLPILYVAAFALGVGETLFDTAAQSILPSIVDKDQLPRANGRLYAVELVMNQFVGPPLGGVLIGISVPLVLASSIFGYALAAVGLTLIVGSFRPQRSGPPTRITTDIAEGLRYLWRNRVLRTLAIMVGVANLAGTATQAVFVLYAVSPGPMDLSEPGVRHPADVVRHREPARVAGGRPARGPLRARAGALRQRPHHRAQLRRAGLHDRRDRDRRGRTSSPACSSWCGT